MKKSIILVLLLINSFQTLYSQGKTGISDETNWTRLWANFKPGLTEYDDSTAILFGNISTNTTLTKNIVYRIMGTVYVTNNAVLNIEPGTVIKGDDKSDGTLVITKGSKIIANGLETDPIVFTSEKNINERKPGDWGGIIILGDAPINKMGGIGVLDFKLDPVLSLYGGKNENDSSGILKYVRIEYAGRKINATNELNGLSLAGVGKKTELDYIQISYSNDDSFEAYGGEVNFNHFISYRATDDDFDFTQGVQCNITNSIALRNPFSSDTSRSRCFEVDSYDKEENADFSKNFTHINASNISMINTVDNNQGLVKEAIYIKENTYFKLTNSLVSGFSAFILLGEKVGVSEKYLSKIVTNEIQINNCSEGVICEYKNNNDAIKVWYENNSINLNYSKINNSDLFIDLNFKKNPDFRKKDTNLVVKN